VLGVRQKITKRLYDGDNKIKLLDQRYLPRWIVVLIDSLLGILSFYLVYLLLETTPIKFHTTISVFNQGVIVVGVNIVTFFLFKTYSGIIRHYTFTDITKLVFSSLTTFVTVFCFNLIYNAVTSEKIFLNTSLVIYLLLSFSTMLLFRVVVKECYLYIKSFTSDALRKKVVIVGVDDTSISPGSAIVKESSLPFKLQGFISKKKDAKRLKILGKPVIPIKTSFKETLSSLDIDGVLLISESFQRKMRNQIVDDCIAQGIEVFNVPNLEKLNKKDDIKNQIKPIEIEDLLERAEIKIDNQQLKNDLNGKSILVTGGAGSIGSEIVKQLVAFQPSLVVILDQAESALHDLENELMTKFPELNFIIELADISNMYRIEALFKTYNFDLVYHAAAYKHVPLIERNPQEAIFVNILGTVNLSILAMNFEIERFVMVSTDKAVNPTNVMGASKRVAEMYVQSLQNEKGVYTRFITTRFGNVLGSSGSVIPRFKQQIEQGGPVTVTHKDIIRYFMTIPEACQLVLQAGTMGSGGEIFVFDMGEPVKILDLAYKMILLSGYEPYVDIDIEITGLRPGEKLYEELLNDSSTTLPTPHPKIMISKVPSEDFDHIKKQVKKLIKSATRLDDDKMVKQLKILVPEFKSQNSSFAKLDSELEKDNNR